jgi:hypothetical protein
MTAGGVVAGTSDAGRDGRLDPQNCTHDRFRIVVTLLTQGDAHGS